MKLESRKFNMKRSNSKDKTGATEKSIWKVGELARGTGFTVRALHHYHELGLIKPSHQFESVEL